MKTVVAISLGSSSQDFEFTATVLGQRLKVCRVGTDGSTAKAQKLLARYGKEADAIALGNDTSIDGDTFVSVSVNAIRSGELVCLWEVALRR